MLARLFPGWALRRAIARARLGYVKAAYEAGKPSRTHPIRGDAMGPDATMQYANVTLRWAARDLDQNHDLAISILDDLVNWTVGTGLTVEPMLLTEDQEPAIDLNRRIGELWQEWSYRPDTAQEMALGELERQIARSLFRDGEILVRHVTGGGFRYPTAIPYILEILEADFLPFEHSRTTSGRNNSIIQGVERDGWGRVVAYHIWRHHPNEYHGRSLMTPTDQALKRVPAEQMSHCKFTRRVRQTRGVPILHGVLHRIQDLKDIEHSERVAAKIDANIAAFIRNMPGLGNNVTRQGDKTRQEQEMESGMMLHQFEGEGLDIHTPKRPNAQLEAFRTGQIRMAAAGTMTRYSAIGRDYNGTYSAQRQELTEGQMNYARLREYLIGVFYKPMWRRFMDGVRLSGQIATREFRGIYAPSLYAADFRGPPLPWIDPDKELKARAGAIDAGLASRQQMIRDMGGDPYLVDAQRAADETNEADEAETTDEEEIDDASVTALATASRR